MVHPHIIHPENTKAPQTPDIDRKLLNYLRVQAVRQRCAPRVDIFTACSLLSPNPAAALDAYSAILIQCLPQALEKSISFYPTGTQDIGFDEAWVMRLIKCILNQEIENVDFLLRRRVNKYKRRALLHLLRSTAEHWVRN